MCFHPVSEHYLFPPPSGETVCVVEQEYSVRIPGSGVEWLLWLSGLLLWLEVEMKASAFLSGPALASIWSESLLLESLSVR